MKPKMLLRGVAVAALIIATQFAPGPAGAVQVTAYKQAVAEAASGNSEIAAFYRARGFEPIWTGEGEEQRARRVALLEAFASARYHGLPAGKYDPNKVLTHLAAVRTGYDRGETEVALSRMFLAFARDLQTGIVDNPASINKGLSRKPVRRAAATYFEGIMGAHPRAFLNSLAPQTQEYARLMKEKLRLETVVAHGGWGPRVSESKLEPGDTGARVVALRNRLVAMGYLKPTITARYDGAMEEAVRQFQATHGLEPDGVAGASTLKAINVSASDRLKSVIVAMERERWLNIPEGLGKRHISVNLTDFKARIYDDDKVTFETRSVVGNPAPDRQTSEFSDEMTHMVVNPSWYVPRSIIVKEYLPKLRANPGAVSHLQITDSRGRQADRSAGFAQYTASSFPFSMRQPPGPGNALGTVKFMFPNKFNIYLHDTPAKSLFLRSVRAFSHGCIRLRDPHDFAYALLARQSNDPVGLFQSVLGTGKETRIDLKEHIPVHLIYRTAFTTARGGVEFRNDIYGRDRLIWEALSAAGVEIGGIQS